MRINEEIDFLRCYKDNASSKQIVFDASLKSLMNIFSLLLQKCNDKLLQQVYEKMYECLSHAYFNVNLDGIINFIGILNDYQKIINAKVLTNCCFFEALTLDVPEIAKNIQRNANERFLEIFNSFNIAYDYIENLRTQNKKQGACYPSWFEQLLHDKTPKKHAFMMRLYKLGENYSRLLEDQKVIWESKKGSVQILRSIRNLFMSNFWSVLQKCKDYIRIPTKHGESYPNLTLAELNKFQIQSDLMNIEPDRLEEIVKLINEQLIKNINQNKGKLFQQLKPTAVSKLHNFHFR